MITFEQRSVGEGTSHADNGEEPGLKETGAPLVCPKDASRSEQSKGGGFEVLCESGEDCGFYSELGEP